MLAVDTGLLMLFTSILRGTILSKEDFVYVCHIMNRGKSQVLVRTVRDITVVFNHGNFCATVLCFGAGFYWTCLRSRWS